MSSVLSGSSPSSGLFFFSFCVVVLWTAQSRVTFLLGFTFLIGSIGLSESSCARKHLSYPVNDRIVCVCNSSFCDPVPSVGPLSSKEAVVISSSKKGDRFLKETLKWGFRDSSRGEADVVLNPLASFQKILGFGGAFTDAAGINIASLSAPTRSRLLNAYYGQDGLKYTLGRVPMASCDFSTREYSYDDTVGDFTLTSFRLAAEDLNYKIPFIKVAQRLSKGRLKLFGSPWSAPGWMKTSGKMSGNGTIIGKPGSKYYKTWAQYFVKFLQAYKSKNITFWALTAQNEPTCGFVFNYSFQTTGFTPETQRDFLKLDLGPALNRSGFGHVRLIILDDQRLMLPQWAHIVLNDALARQFVSGIGVHWYYDAFVPAKVLSETLRNHPKLFILGTEACEGWAPWQIRGPILGSWDRAEAYARDIIDDLNHGVAGWTDWNLALDLNGGPNWVKNFVDSPIIVNKSSDEFYKQPMFYALGHFSAFVPPDSARVAVKIKTTSKVISVTGFTVPSSLNRVLVILNRGLKSLSLTVAEFGEHKRVLKVNLSPKSIKTVLWKKT